MDAGHLGGGQEVWDSAWENVEGGKDNEWCKNIRRLMLVLVLSIFLCVSSLEDDSSTLNAVCINKLYDLHHSKR